MNHIKYPVKTRFIDNADKTNDDRFLVEINYYYYYRQLYFAPSFFRIQINHFYKKNKKNILQINHEHEHDWGSGMNFEYIAWNS